MKFCKNRLRAEAEVVSDFFVIITASLFVFLTLNPLAAQNVRTDDDDALFIKKIFDEELANGRCNEWLRELCHDVGHRLAGSEGERKAQVWAQSTLDELGLDAVWAQPCQVPVWRRGEPERAFVLPTYERASMTLRCLALGGSIGTGPNGIEAEVIEVKNFEELEKLGAANVEGKIVFYDRPFDATQINTFRAYGGAVDQRGTGAIRAAKLGAIGTIVRSMASQIDDWPHTGGMRYEDDVPKIPSIAIATSDAERLSKLLKSEKGTKIFFKTSCQTLDDAPSANIIGELRGFERPDEIITIGGHLDSWDVGQGAHDDGAGCVQSMEALYLLKKLGYKPRRTIRCVLFANEENGLRGGKAYFEEAKSKDEKHFAAVESDAGGFTPRGFGFEAKEDVFLPLFEKIKAKEGLFLPYGIQFSKGGGGADIGPLKPLGALLVGLQPDSQRYFDFHHTDADVFEAVHPRELRLGAAALTAMIWALDQL